MQTQIEKHFLKVDIFSLLGELTGDHKRELIDALACENDVIDAVCEQIIDGYTSYGSSHGAKTFSFVTTPYNALDRARRRIAESRDVVAEEELEKAVTNLKELEKKNEELQQKVWDIANHNERLSSVIRRTVAALEVHSDVKDFRTTDALWILREVRQC